jgi:HAD superfamily hydrolase (TIGR01549 family)
MIKAVIFDADGVLLDNTKVYMKAYRETGRRLGLKVPSDSIMRKAFGLRWEDMLKIFYGSSNEKIRNTYIGFVRSFEHEIKVMGGLEYVLKKLKVRKAITTSKSRSTLKNQLGGLINFFEVIVTREDTEKHKPNPEPILLACKKLDIKPEEVVYVGDALIDCEAAKNAGTSFIGFISGAASEEDFESVNVKFITSLKDLLKELQKRYLS